jgi:hypothetical protein
MIRKRNSRPASGKRGPSESGGTELNVYEPRYLLGQVATAANISPGLLKAWVTRGVIVLGEHDRGAHGKGSSRVFTLERALCVGLAAELVKLGIVASYAGELSTGFFKWALDSSGGKLSKLSHLLVVYSMEGRGIPRGMMFGRADWTSTMQNVVRDSPMPEDVISFTVVNVKTLVEKIVERLEGRD